MIRSSRRNMTQARGELRTLTLQRSEDLLRLLEEARRAGRRQAAVAATAQVIMAAEVTQATCDNHQLLAMFNQVKGSMGRTFVWLDT